MQIAEQVTENQRLKNMLLEMESIRSKEAKEHSEQIARLNIMVAEEENNVAEGRGMVCHLSRCCHICSL